MYVSVFTVSDLYGKKDAGIICRTSCGAPKDKKFQPCSDTHKCQDA